MSDTSLNKIIQYGTDADRLAFVPDPAASSQVLYIWYVTDSPPDVYIWDGSVWVFINDLSAAGITQLTGDITAGPGSGSQAATIGANKVLDTMLRDSAAVSVIGRSANSSGDPADIAAASNDTFLQRVSNALTWAGLTIGMIANSLITYAKIQNVSATSRILGRKTAGAGVIEECTLSEVLDFVGSAAQGDILYRDASGWTRLAAGTSGQLLKTQGAAANPTWATISSGSSWTLAYSQALSGANSYSLNGLGTPGEIMVIISGATFGVSDRTVLQVSVDNGSNYLGTGEYPSIAGSGALTSQNNLQFYDANATAARYGAINILGCNAAAPKACRSNFFSTDNINLRLITNTGQINAVKVFSAGANNFSGGTAYVYYR